MVKDFHHEAVEYLKKDQFLGPIIESIPLKQHNGGEDVYSELLESIIYQQISIKAAHSIKQRFYHLFDDGDPAPEALLKLSVEDLRTAGVSKQKAGYLLNIAGYFQENKLLHFSWETLDDDEIIKRLTEIKGVGLWTAQMVLIFTLNRPDIFPVADLGIKNACIKLWNLQGTNSEIQKDMIKNAEPWRPYRSVASRYLWSWISS